MWCRSRCRSRRLGLVAVWLVAVAAAAVVVLVVDGLALLTRVSGTDSPVATTPTDPVSSSTWSRVPDDEAVFGGADRPDLNRQWMNGVTAGGPGLVAVGTDGTGIAYPHVRWSGASEDFDAAVWTWGN